MAEHSAQREWTYDYASQCVVFYSTHKKVLETKARYTKYLQELEGKHNLLVCAKCEEYYEPQELVDEVCSKCAAE